MTSDRTSSESALPSHAARPRLLKTRVPLTAPVKLALWAGSIGLGAYLLRRVLNRSFFGSSGRRIDVGAVSDTWLANQRGTVEEFPYF